MHKEKTEEKKNIALIIETSNAYGRGLLHGIRGYIESHKNWTIYLGEHSRGKPKLAWLKNWNGDGIIARIENKFIAHIISEIKIPTIDVSSGRFIPNLVWVETNDQLIAELAAEHLINCGLKNFAYCYDPYFNWAKWRRKSFKKIISNLNYPYFEYKINTLDSKKGWFSEQNKLGNWLKSLPKPIGIMACYDICGLKIIETCRTLGMLIPDEVAIIGVDNDDLLCNLSDPKLSSVIPNTYETGYKSAELLDRLMRGENISDNTYLIDPIGVATRQSTNILAIKDKYVLEVINFIKHNFQKNITVKDCLQNIPLSRRVIERRFLKELNRTIYNEIVRLKLNKVKQLLIETEIPLYDIAIQSGFKYIEYMSSLFKKKFGIPPSHYRVRHEIKSKIRG